MNDLSWVAAQLGKRQPNHSLPQGLYTDQRAFDFDLTAIYGQSWLMAAMECELPDPGSYLALKVGQAPVLLVRDKQGAIRAFHNSCRHRGSILCQDGYGSAPKLVCPYHRWTYDLDGSLFAAGRMDAGFDKTEHGLIPIALQLVAGAIFICLADEPPAFDAFGENFARYAEPHDFSRLKLVASDLMIEQANWKLVMENARECYHCPTGHPELATSFPVQMAGHFSALRRPDASGFAQAMDRVGLPHAALEGPWWQLARIELNSGSSSISMDGQALCSVPLITANDGNVGSLRWALDPHMFAHATADHVFVFTCIPVGPRETHVLSRWYVHRDAREGVDYDLPALKELWLKTNAQDRDLAENNHSGVVSPGYRPGPYSHEAETLVIRLVDWYCDRAQDYVARHD